MRTLLLVAAALLCLGWRAPFGSVVCPSVIAPSGLLIQGIEINAPGVFSWPLASGDEVLAREGALLLFPDHSKLYLAKGSRVKLESLRQVRLLTGSLAFRFAPRSAVKVIAGEQSAAAGQAASGTAVLTRGRAALTFGTQPPAFEWAEQDLLRQLNWTMGVYLP